MSGEYHSETPLRGSHLRSSYSRDLLPFQEDRIFGHYATDQLVEIAQNYRPLDGLWLDLYRQPSPLNRLIQVVTGIPGPKHSYDRYTLEAFQSKHGKPIHEADDKEVEDFIIKTRRDFLLEIQKAVRTVQPQVSFTWNDAGLNDIVRPNEASLVDSLVDWFSMEGHTWAGIDTGSRLGHVADRPFEVGILLNSSWYVPMTDQAPPPAMSENEAVVSAANAWIQGANVYAAVTPGHSGQYDENGDLRLLQAIGGWLKENRSWLTGTVPYADVGILLGNPSSDIQQIPTDADLWRQSHQLERDLLEKVGEHPGLWPDRGLRNAGYFTEFVGGSFARREFDLKSYRILLVPETALLDDVTVERVRQYVRSGGKILAFGHASLYDQRGRKKTNFALSDVFGVDFLEKLPGYKQMAISVGSGLASTLPLNSGALAVKATSATVLATWRSAGDSPAVVENHFGKGVCIYSSAEEIAFGEGSALLEELIARLIGPPPVTIQGGRKYSLLMNRMGSNFLLYLLSRSTASRTSDDPYRAANPHPPVAETVETVRVTMDSSVLGEFEIAETIPKGNRLTISRRAGSSSFYVEASPSVTTVRLVKTSRKTDCMRSSASPLSCRMRRPMFITSRW